MKTAKNQILCWDPGTDRVAMVPWPDKQRLSNDYSRTDLAVFTRVREMKPLERQLFVFAAANSLIHRDKCDLDAVHRAFSELEEYRSALPVDLPPHGGWRPGEV